MSPLNPRTALATHDVTNQPPPFEDVNLFATDAALREAVKREGGEMHTAHLNQFGARVGSAEVIAWSFEANRNPPELKTFDRFGRRIDEVNFHPSYHKLMELGLKGGVASLAWTAPKGGHVAHTAILCMLAQIEQGVCCPMTMTYAALPALRNASSTDGRWPCS